MKTQHALGFAAVVFSASLSTSAKAVSIMDFVDGGNAYPWERVELPGTVCGNGSQYKFWFYDNPASNNLLLLFEGGGACWDYGGCSGQRGSLGAANRNGLPNDYITRLRAQYVSPILNGADPGIPLRAKRPLPTKGWDVVFMPYCTGDVFIGSSETVYRDPTGTNPPLTWQHAGFSNLKAALAFLAGRFPTIDKLLVTGFSAGGVASASGYYTVRTALRPARGYMLNDSGPTFPAPNSTFNSRPLHEQIRKSWKLDTLFSQLPPSFDSQDFGSMTRVLSSEFPNDQLAYTGYLSDYNFSRFSYELFFPNQNKNLILQRWREDMEVLVTTMNRTSNFSYHIPWERPINDSHCSTILTFIGSHACPSVRRKRGLEVLEPPFSQPWKCPRGLVGMGSFLERWINRNERIRSIEPANGYNRRDPGMRLVAPLINDALRGL